MMDQIYIWHVFDRIVRMSYDKFYRRVKREKTISHSETYYKVIQVKNKEKQHRSMQKWVMVSLSQDKNKTFGSRLLLAHDKSYRKQKSKTKRGLIRLTTVSKTAQSTMYTTEIKERHYSNYINTK